MNRRFARAALAALLLSAPPGVAAAQDPRLDGRIDPTTRAAVAAVVDSARAQGLPTEPLVQKALQGATRGADGRRIAEAVRRLSGELAAARQALGARSTGAEIEAGASALRAGAPAAELARLRGQRPDRPLTVALGTLSDLVAQGVPVDTALAVTSALWQRNASDDELVAVRRQVGRDVAAGAAPAASAVVRARGAGRGAGGAGVGGVSPPVPRAPKGRPANPGGGPGQRPPRP